MEIYDIEKQKIEQEAILSDIQRYVEVDSLNEELHKVEFNLFRKLLKYGQSLLKEVIANHETGEEERQIETSYEKTFSYYGKRSRSYLSIFGMLDIVRAYYRSSDGEGCCPLDSVLNLPEHRYSYLLQDWTESKICETTYDTAIDDIFRILDIKLPKRALENAAVELTSDIDKFQFQKEAPPEESEGSVICVTADCKGVRMVSAEKPKSAKSEETNDSPFASKGNKRCGCRRDAVVTSDYSFIPKTRSPAEISDALMKRFTSNDTSKSVKSNSIKKESQEERKPLNKTTYATMQGKSVAFVDMLDRVYNRDPTNSKPIYILLDGAPSLKSGICEEIRLRGWDNRIAGICLDIIHVSEYVWDAAKALFGDKKDKRIFWVGKTLRKILEGHVGHVIGGLRQRVKNGRLSAARKKVLKRVIVYFENHRDMMKYNKYLSLGYSIATGVIEGACGSLVKDRTDYSGMRWTEKGVQAVLDLRALKRNGDWDDYWKYHLKQEKQRLYKNVA